MLEFRPSHQHSRPTEKRKRDKGTLLPAESDSFKHAFQKSYLKHVLSLLWPELSHMAKPNSKERLENIVSILLLRKRGRMNIEGQLVLSDSLILQGLVQDFPVTAVP